jgi:hypothetical protein
MADEEVVSLLKEIRDLQKLHVENYKDALRHQEISIEMQKKASRRQKISLLVVGIIVFLGIAVSIMPFGCSSSLMNR